MLVAKAQHLDYFMQNRCHNTICSATTLKLCYSTNLALIVHLSYVATLIGAIHGQSLAYIKDVLIQIALLSGLRSATSGQYLLNALLSGLRSATSGQYLLNAVWTMGNFCCCCCGMEQFICRVEVDSRY